MPLYDLSYKIVDLQNKCKDLGLSYAGGKQVLVDRLNSFLEVNSSDNSDKFAANFDSNDYNLDPNDDNFDTNYDNYDSNGNNIDLDEDGEEFQRVSVLQLEYNSDEQDYEEIQGSAKRKRATFDYEADPEPFACYQDAVNKIKSECYWTKDRLEEGKKETKERYICKASAKCQMRLYILFNKEDEGVSIWRTTVGHTHDECVRNTIGYTLIP